MAEWEWRPEITGEAKRKGTLLAAAYGGGALVCTALAIATPGRFLIVMAVMLAGLFILGRLSTRQLMSFRATVEGSTLTLRDSRATTSIDLRQVDDIAVRRRSSSQADRRWVIEALGDGAPAMHALAPIEAIWALPEEAIESLRSGIDHYHGWYRGTPAPVADDPYGATAVMPAMRVQDRYEWRPPRRPTADRNQRRVLMATVLIAGAIAVIAAIQNWGDTLGVVLSVLIVPGIVLLLGLGAWYAYTPAKKFRLVVDGAEIQAWRGENMTQSVRLAGATEIIVDVTHSRNHSTNTNHTHPWVRVVRADGTERISLPVSLGQNLDAEARLLLERDLRRHAGLA